MTRDYSDIFGAPPAPMERKISPLERLGWKPFFARQCPAEPSDLRPVRVMEVHRSGLRVMGAQDDTASTLPPNPEVTVGDWLLVGPEGGPEFQLLERTSLFKRKAPGSGRGVQLIAANVDTAFITTSCNHDFNVARLERYIALAFEADTTPVILLTKADLAEDPNSYADQARAISDRVPVLTLNARGPEPQEKLLAWCKPGQTIVFLGSSGVGKSTLVNALSAQSTAETQTIRENDSKGRHTTTSRQLHLLPEGYVVMDTPGMRELQLTDSQAGLAEVFADLEDLASRCKFNDCSHVTEPGCAVQAALKAGTLDPQRLERWRKLEAEERHNSASLHERRSNAKSFQKRVKNAVRHKKR